MTNFMKALCRLTCGGISFFFCDVRLAEHAFDNICAFEIVSAVNGSCQANSLAASIASALPLYGVRSLFRLFASTAAERQRRILMEAEWWDRYKPANGQRDVWVLRLLTALGRELVSIEQMLSARKEPGASAFGYQARVCESALIYDTGLEGQSARDVSGRGCIWFQLPRTGVMACLGSSSLNCGREALAFDSRISLPGAIQESSKPALHPKRLSPTITNVVAPHRA